MVGDPKTEVEVRRSKCLTQGDEDLCRFNAWRCVEVVADIHSYRPDRRFVTKTDAQSIRVARPKPAKPYTVKHIPAIVERDQP